MKILFASILLMNSAYNCFAIPTLPELDLQKENKIKVARNNYNNHLSKCDFLLKSASSQSVFIEALKYVLERRMPSSKIFDQLENQSSKKSIQARLEIAELITKQSLELQKLIVLADSNDIVKFNHTSQLMMRQFELIDNLTKQTIKQKALEIEDEPASINHSQNHQIAK